MARNRNCRPSRLKAMTHIFLLLSIPFRKTIGCSYRWNDHN